MAWDLGELISRVSRAVGRRADISQSDLSFWCNEAYQEVTDVAPHSLLERIAVSSTTSGENRISLPADFKELRVLSWLTPIGSSQTLTQIKPGEADAEFTVNIDKVGISDRYVLYNDWIELIPSPDSAYSLQMRYDSFVTDLTATTDVPSVSTPWRRAVYYKAKELIESEHLNDPETAAMARSQYLDYVQTIPNDRARRQRASDRRGVNVVYR